MKKVFISFLSLVIFCLVSTTALAENEFSTSYDVAYDISADGVTEVTQKITLKNLTSQYYASNFTLTIGSTTVSGIVASDPSGQMETKVEKQNNKTVITAKLNQQVVGVDKTQTFTLKFKSNDFAQVIGKTWEVNLPRLPESKNIEGYNLLLSVPVSFGDPTSISPTPKSESQTYERLYFSFSKDQLEKSGVSVNFGTNQVFDFTLKYSLENSALFPTLATITLPSDTEYQDVALAKVNPEPLNVTIDEDGNYLAWYKLEKRSKLEILVTGGAKLYISPKSKKTPILSGEQIKLWTKSDRFWEKDNPAIKAVISEIFKGNVPASNHEKARLIYRYTVETLKYDTSRLNDDNIERLGAVTVLNNPKSAVCMEFTDLFIALSRAVGVPARELDGFAYSLNRNLRPLSLNKDLLHAWPEYFDEEKGWVMVDPTWENTSGGVDYFNKFDLNHLALAIKGASSTTPFTSNDVKVTVSSEDFSSKPQIDAQVEVSDVLLAGLPATLSVKIANQGTSLQPPLKLTLSTNQLKTQGQVPLDVGPIPPFGSLSYKFNLKTPFTLKELEETVEITLGNQKVTKKIKIQPFFLSYPLPYIFGGAVAFILGIYSMVLIVHLYRRKSLD